MKKRLMIGVLTILIACTFFAGIFPGQVAKNISWTTIKHLTQTFTKRLIAAQDIFFATGNTGSAETFTTTTADGYTLTLTKPDASYLKFRTAISGGPYSVEDLVNGTAGWNILSNKPVITVGDKGYATLAAAVTAIGSTQATLVLPSGNHVGGGVTVPDTLALKALKGANITVANGTTLTINGTFDAGLYKIFSYNTTLPVVFGPGAVARAYPQWFGATGNYDIAGGVGTDDFAALQACANSLYPAGGKIYLPTGVYYVTEGWRLPPNVTLEGDGVTSIVYAKATTFVFYGAGHAGDDYSAYIIRVPYGELTSDPVATNVTVRNIKVQSDGNSDTSTPSTHNLEGPGGIITRCDYTTVENCSFEGIWREALDQYGTGRRGTLFKENRFYNCNHNAININGPNSGTIVDNYIYRCGNGIEASGGTEGDDGGAPAITYYDLGGLIIANNTIVGVWTFGIKTPSMYGTVRYATNGITIEGNNIIGDSVLARYPTIGIEISSLADGITAANNIIRWVNQVGIWIRPIAGYVANNKNITVLGNQITDCINSADVVWSSGIYISGVAAAGYANDVILSNNRIKCTSYATYHMKYGVKIEPSMRGPLTLTGNHIEGVEIAGVYAENAFVQNWRITNNILTGIGSQGIVVDNSSGSGKNVSVSGNSITGHLGTVTGSYNKVHIHLENLYWAECINNTFSDSATDAHVYALYLNNCEDTMVGGNKFSGGTKYLPMVYDGGTTNGTYNYMEKGYIKVASGTAAPTTGRWSIGSLIKNTAPATGQPPFWSCSAPTAAQGWGKQGGSSTTGDITSGLKVLTVASAAGWEPGDAITIAGAGPASANLTTCVRLISGTTFTVEDAAGTTVTGAACTHVTPTWKAHPNLP